MYCKIPSASIDLETIVDSALIGGFILETEGKSIDASIATDLKEIKMQFLNNEYLHRIR
ncbi:MAG: F0F1 ATP synthase subunit delta [Ferruginibacter sp.]